jgi:hypothetical protein
MSNSHSNNDSYIRIQTGKYLSDRFFIESLFFLPSLIYCFAIIYIMHLSKSVSLSARKINKKTLNNKTRILVVLICYYFYQIVFLCFIGFDLNYADLFILLLFQFVNIVVTVLTPFALKEISLKIFPQFFKNIFFNFWCMMIIKFLAEIYYEVYENLFSHYLSFSVPALITASILVYNLYKYPRDDVYPTKSEVYYELQYLPLLTKSEPQENMGKEGKRDYGSRLKKFVSSKPRLFDKQHSFNSTKVKSYHDFELSLDDVSQNRPEMLPIYPKIEIQIKNDYKYYQSDFSNELDQSDFIMVKGDLSDNFFFQILVTIKDLNISIKVRRNLKDFQDLEQDLKSEFSFNKYSKKLSKNLPILKKIKSGDSLNFFKNYKMNFEIFLKNILSEPCYITEDVLNFLELKDERLKYSYELARKKNLNVAQIRDDTFLTKKNENSNDDIIIRESITRLKEDIILDKNNIKSDKNLPKIPNLVSPRINPQTNFQNKLILNVLEIKKETLFANDYMVKIRVTQSMMFRIITKKLKEILDVIYEMSVLNKNNENIKNLMSLHQVLSKDNFPKFTKLLENVLQNGYDNKVIYQANQIIFDFFSEFSEDQYSRCESMVSNIDRENLIDLLKKKKNNDEKSKMKKDAKYYKELVIQSQIKSVSVTVAGAIFLSTQNFEVSEFYTTLFYFEFFDGHVETLKKKLKYKEINQFINFIAIKLNIVSKLIKLASDDLSEEEKIKVRKNELQTNLDEIFRKLNIVADSYWLEILEADRDYTLYKLNKKNVQAKKPSLLFDRNGSMESILGLVTRDSLV